MSAQNNLSSGGGNASSAITAAGSLLSTLGDNVLGYLGMETQNDWNLKQWNRENEYNLPSNQVARLKAAGLNPALMYDNGASGLISAQSPQSADPNFGINQMLASQIALTNAQAKLADSQATAVQDENARANELQPFNVQNLQANNEVLKQSVKNMSAQEQDIYKQWTFKSAEIAISQQMADKQCEHINKMMAQLDEDIKITAENYRQLVALYDLKKQGIELNNQLIQSQIHVNEAEAAKLIKTLDLIDSQISLNYTQGVVSVRQQGLSEAMAPFEAQFKKDAAALQNNQAYYWKKRVKYFDFEQGRNMFSGHKINASVGPISVGASN